MNTNEKSLFDVMTEFEYVELELERVRDLLSIFNERVAGDVELLNEGLQAEYFKTRYQESQSLLDTLYIQLKNSIQSMNETILTGFGISKRKKAAAQTE